MKTDVHKKDNLKFNQAMFQTNNTAAGTKLMVFAFWTVFFTNTVWAGYTNQGKLTMSDATATGSGSNLNRVTGDIANLVRNLTTDKSGDSVAILKKKGTPNTFGSNGASPNPESLRETGTGNRQFLAVANPTPVATTSMIFNAGTKAANKNLAVFNRPIGATTVTPSLSTNLYAFTNKDSMFLADGNLAQFDDSYNPGVDWQDAKKMSNTNETFSILCNDVPLAADRRPLLAMNDTLFYNLIKTTAKKYQFQLIATNLDKDNLAGFVQDQFTHTSMPINMNGTTKINFAITGNKASAAADRFRLIFKPSVVYTSITTNVLGSDIGVLWNVAGEENIKGYEIERSTDGTHFTKVADKPSVGNSNAPVQYNWLDVSPALGIYYYRIRSISYNNVTGYSNVAKVKLNRSTPAIYVFPNPVTENVIHLQMNSLPKGIYDARLISNLGQVVGVSHIDHLAPTATETIRPVYKLLSGSYLLEITAPDKTITIVKVIVQ